MEDWSTNEMEYQIIGSVDDKILTKYQPSLENLDILDQYQTRILLLLFLEGTTKCSTSSLSFQGIKRKLDLHQQILTNALNRLIDKKFILKREGDNHYFLTQKGLQFIQLHVNMTNSKLNHPKKWPTIERVYMTDISTDDFLDIFRGKWFGDFRWVGWFQDTNSIKLEWISTDNSVEAIAWHGSSNDSSYPYLIKTILFQKSPTISPEELKQKADWFKFHFNKKLAKIGIIVKEYPFKNTDFRLSASKNNQWFYQSCVN